jgi:hypothetical protein
MHGKHSRRVPLLDAASVSCVLTVEAHGKFTTKLTSCRMLDAMEFRVHLRSPGSSCTPQQRPPQTCYRLFPSPMAQTTGRRKGRAPRAAAAAAAAAMTISKDERKEVISKAIRVVPHFPKEGIMFQDVTTILLDPEAFAHAIDLFYERYAGMDIDVVAGAAPGRAAAGLLLLRDVLLVHWHGYGRALRPCLDKAEHRPYCGALQSSTLLGRLAAQALRRAGSSLARPWRCASSAPLCRSASPASFQVREGRAELQVASAEGRASNERKAAGRHCGLAPVLRAWLLWE